MRHLGWRSSRFFLVGTLALLFLAIGLRLRAIWRPDRVIFARPRGTALLWTSTDDGLRLDVTSPWPVATRFAWFAGKELPVNGGAKFAAWQPGSLDDQGTGLQQTPPQRDWHECLWNNLRAWSGPSEIVQIGTVSPFGHGARQRN